MSGCLLQSISDYPAISLTCSATPCTLCPTGKYIDPSKVCDGSTFSDTQQNGCLPCKTCSGSDTVAYPCTGLTYTDTSKCVSVNSNSFPRCDAGYFTNPFLSTQGKLSITDDSDWSWVNRTLIDPTGTYFASLHKDGRCRVYPVPVAPDFTQQTFVAEGCSSSPLTVGVVWATGQNPQPILYSVTNTGVIGKLARNSAGVWENTPAFSSPRPGIDTNLVPALNPNIIGIATNTYNHWAPAVCVSVPHLVPYSSTYPWTTVVLICAFNSLEMCGFLTEINSDGSRSAPILYQTTYYDYQYFVKKWSYELLYDHVENCLYWGLYQITNEGGAVYIFKLFKIYLKYDYSFSNFQVAHEVLGLFALNKLYFYTGNLMRGASVDPITGSIFFYSFGNNTQQYFLLAWNMPRTIPSTSQVNSVEISTRPIQVLPKPNFDKDPPTLRHAKDSLTLKSQSENYLLGMSSTRWTINEYEIQSLIRFTTVEREYRSSVGRGYLKKMDNLYETDRIQFTNDGRAWVDVELETHLFQGASFPASLSTPQASCLPCMAGKSSSGGPLMSCTCTGQAFAPTLDDSCSPWTPACSPGNIQLTSPNSTHDRTCQLCTCSDGQYISVSDNTCGCTACTPCGAPDMRITGTDPVSNVALCSGRGVSNRGASTPCVSCKTCADMQYITSPCSGAGSIDTVQCRNCDPCPEGQYIQDGFCTGQGKSPVSCNSCFQCEGDSSPNRTSPAYCDGTTRSDPGQDICIPCSFCPEGQIFVGGCNSTHGYPFCSSCPACPAGKYQHTGCLRGNAPICEACLGCQLGEYIRSTCPAGSTSDVHQCAPCRTCPTGSYKANECPGNTESDSSSCSLCAECPDGKYVASPCNGSTNDPYSRVCQPCTPCPPGSYIEGCNHTSQGPEDRQCVECPPCESNLVLGTQCTGGSVGQPDQVCSECQGCPAGQRLTSTCSSSQDPSSAYSRRALIPTTCSSCSSCSTGQYIYQCTSLGTECKMCDGCSPDQYISSPCDGSGASSTARQCSPCEYTTNSSSPPAQCLAGQYRSFCSGYEDADTSGCSNCLSVECGNGYYISRACDGSGYSSTPACSACQACPPNYYSPEPCHGNTTADTQAQSGCLQCKCPPGQYLVKSCSGQGPNDSKCSPIPSLTTTTTTPPPQPAPLPTPPPLPVTPSPVPQTSTPRPTPSPTPPLPPNTPTPAPTPENVASATSPAVVAGAVVGSIVGVALVATGIYLATTAAAAGAAAAAGGASAAAAAAAGGEGASAAAAGGAGGAAVLSPMPGTFNPMSSGKQLDGPYSEYTSRRKGGIFEMDKKDFCYNRI